MQKVTKNISGYMAIIAILVLYFVNTLVYKFIPEGSVHDWAYYLVSGTLLLLISVGVPMLLGFDIKGRTGVRKKLDFTSLLLVVLAGCLLMVFGLGYSNILYYTLQAIGYNSISTLPVTDTVGKIMVAFVGMAILPALGEEFLVRGSIFQSLKGSKGTKSAILLTSLFFAVMHGNVTQLGHQFLVGLVCAVVITVGGSIWYGVILHLTNNAVTIGLNILNSTNKLQVIITPSQFFTSWDFLVAIALMILGFVGVYFVIRYLMKRRYGRFDEKVKLLTAIERFEGEKPQEEYVDKVQNRLFYCAIIAFSAMVVLDFVLVLCGVTL